MTGWLLLPPLGRLLVCCVAVGVSWHAFERLGLRKWWAALAAWGLVMAVAAFVQFGMGVTYD